MASATLCRMKRVNALRARLLSGGPGAKPPQKRWPRTDAEAAWNEGAYGGPGGLWPPDRALLRLKPLRRCANKGYGERYAMPHKRGVRPTIAVTERALLRLKPSRRCANMGDCERYAVPHKRGVRPTIAVTERGTGGGAPRRGGSPQPCAGVGGDFPP